MNNESDFYVEGFKKLDPKIVEKNPPKIKWGEQYKNRTDAEKITYLEKLASAMNHAAYLIQKERDELNKLCELKEKQLAQVKKGIDANNMMLQQEITRMNTQRQDYNEQIATLSAKIRKFESEK